MPNIYYPIIMPIIFTLSLTVIRHRPSPFTLMRPLFENMLIFLNMPKGKYNIYKNIVKQFIITIFFFLLLGSK